MFSYSVISDIASKILSILRAEPGKSEDENPEDLSSTWDKTKSCIIGRVKSIRDVNVEQAKKFTNSFQDMKETIKHDIDSTQWKIIKHKFEDKNNIMELEDKITDTQQMIRNDFTKRSIDMKNEIENSKLKIQSFFIRPREIKSQNHFEILPGIMTVFEKIGGIVVEEISNSVRTTPNTIQLFQPVARQVTRRRLDDDIVLPLAVEARGSATMPRNNMRSYETFDREYKEKSKRLQKKRQHMMRLSSESTPIMKPN